MGRAQREKKKARQQQQAAGMEVEGWQTGPLGAAQAEDFIGMDTGEAGQQQAGAAAGQPGPRERVERVRGRASSKQKAKKRKSLEKALAVADRTETKVAKTTNRAVKKKGLKKLWQNDAKDE